MLDKAVLEFLEKLKEEWLRKQIAPKITEDKINKLKHDADEMFSKSWLEKIIKNLSNSKDVGRLKYTTHPPKFSHPDAKLDAINFESKNKRGNFLATGNLVCVNLDMYSNSGAAYLKKDYIYVYEFLVSKLQDDRMVVDHLRASTPEVQDIFAQLNINKSFAEVSTALIGLVNLNQPTETSGKIKQIYFPVAENYHLLSLLAASPLMTELKTRINHLNFSDKNEEVRAALKNKSPVKAELNVILNLTKIGYGGANKQNISVLNNKDGGYFYLLSSTPPLLEKRQTQPPKIDFFENCLWVGLFKKDFVDFHKVLSWRKNNKDIRDMRDDIVLNALTRVKRLMEQIRAIQAGWSDSKIYDDLDHWQKVWLDEKYAEIRNDSKRNHDYLSKSQSYFANWFIGYYKQTTKDNKLLGDDDIEHIKKILSEERELLE